MKNYVISLSTATNRREHIKAEFGKQGIEFEFFDAVTPNQVPFLAQSFGISLAKSNLTGGELACLFSHLCLWQKALDDNIPHITIFEDDVYLGKNAHLFLNNSQWIPKECVLIKLEHYLDKLTLGKKITTIHNRDIRPLGEFNWGTAGYIIHQDAIKELINLTKKVFTNKPLPIDHIMFEIAIAHHAVYQMSPALCVQSDRTQQKDRLQSMLELERRKRMDSTPKPTLTLSQKIIREITRLFTKTCQFTSKQKVYFQ